jgi:hypothetical protein
MITGNQGTTLLDAARLCSWPTAREADGRKGVRSDLGAEMERRRTDGGIDLPTTAKMSTWATPKASDAPRGGSIDHMDGRRSNLMDQAQTAGWCTPTARDWKSETAETAEKADHTSRQAQLSAPLGPWATPTAGEKIRSPEFSEGRTPTTREAFSAAGWATPVATELGNTLENYRAMKANMTSGPRTAITHPSLQAQLVVSGPDATGSGAKTGSTGQLNPAHSLWLMGLPVAWLFAAPRDKPSKKKPSIPPPTPTPSTGTTEPEPSPGAETPSSAKSPPRSSKPRSKRSRKPNEPK